MASHLLWTTISLSRRRITAERPPDAQWASHPPKRAERPVRSWEPGASLGVLGEYGLPRRGDAVAWHAPRLPLVKLGLHGAHPPALRW